MSVDGKLFSDDPGPAVFIHVFSEIYFVSRGSDSHKSDLTHLLLLTLCKSCDRGSGNSICCIIC